MRQLATREEDALFLPDLCGLRPLFIVLLFAQLLAIVLTLGAVAPDEPRFQSFGFISLFTQLTALSIAAALCLARQPMSRLGEPVAVTLSSGLMIAVTIAVAEATWWSLSHPEGIPGVIRSGHMDFLGRVTGISAVVCALALRYFFVQHHWRIRIASESRARIQALQARIRPHFFFNCMNTIASLTRSDPALAERAVEDLADLFRVSLSDGEALVTLEEEVDLTRRYLAIEQLRLGDRLNVNWRTDAEAVNARLPALTVQPLVENAIYHGIEPLARGGRIDITISRAGERVSVVIENPMTAGATERHGSNRMAQQNVTERLAAHFGSEGRLMVHKDAMVDGGKRRYRATLSFPYRP